MYHPEAQLICSQRLESHTRIYTTIQAAESVAQFALRYKSFNLIVLLSLSFICSPNL